MARSFDATNDVISFGNDASVNDFNAGKTISFFLVRSAVDVTHAALVKDFPNSQWGSQIQSVAGVDSFRYVHLFTGGTAQWKGTIDLNSTSAVYHIVVTYDASSATNDPIIYINGVVDTLSVNTNSTGTPVSDASDPLLFGENGDGGFDLGGVVMCIAYDNRVWTAEEVNRARWWGRPMGGIQVYHPMFTDKLTNEAAATANGSATGTTVTPLACPVVRPGTAMMGAMVGW